MKPITLTPRHVVELRTQKFLDEMRRRNQRNVIEFKPEAVSPAAPSNPARGMAIGVLVGGAFWGGLFLVRWIIRLCS
jgi:hypothetical protein